jgi:hypothetical protein
VNNIPTGLIVVGAAMLLFYLRLGMLRGRKRRLARTEALEIRRSLKKRRAMEEKKPCTRLNGSRRIIRNTGGSRQPPASSFLLSASNNPDINGSMTG